MRVVARPWFCIGVRHTAPAGRPREFVNVVVTKERGVEVATDTGDMVFHVVDAHDWRGTRVHDVVVAPEFAAVEHSPEEISALVEAIVEAALGRPAAGDRRAARVLTDTPYAGDSAPAEFEVLLADDEAARDAAGVSVSHERVERDDGVTKVTFAVAGTRRAADVSVEARANSVLLTVRGADGSAVASETVALAARARPERATVKTHRSGDGGLRVVVKLPPERSRLERSRRGGVRVRNARIAQRRRSRAQRRRKQSAAARGETAAPRRACAQAELRGAAAAAEDVPMSPALDIMPGVALAVGPDGEPRNRVPLQNPFIFELL